MILIQTKFINHNCLHTRFSESASASDPPAQRRGREFFIDNLLVQIHFIIVMIGWTGLAPWNFEFPFPGSLAIDLPRTEKKQY